MKKPAEAGFFFYAGFHYCPVNVMQITGKVMIIRSKRAIADI